MPDFKQIEECARQAAQKYPIKCISLFGSYAEGRQTAASDVDLLVEFLMPSVSLLTLAGVKAHFEDSLSVPVDVLHAPLPDDSILQIGKVLPLYEQ
ncbi:MAG: nucleotidyltransferase domain-containing protein [Bacillota bacterium]|nr:nucleotidyltransferase domain-containing protein [Bacillota bacterium]